MMQMLAAGGLPLLTDGIRIADQDNLQGYYEYEQVKSLSKGDCSWLLLAKGKAVKIISGLLMFLPDGYQYHVLFMRRAIPEVLASQQYMLDRRKTLQSTINDVEMTEVFQRHLDQLYSWIQQQPHFRFLEVNFNHLIQDPLPWPDRICKFLDRKMDHQKMLSVINPNLYRQRCK